MKKYAVCKYHLYMWKRLEESKNRFMGTCYQGTTMYQVNSHIFLGLEDIGVNGEKRIKE